MTRTRRLWMTTGALVLLGWGVLAWMGHLREAERGALLAEIETARAARRWPGRPEVTAEGRETAELYLAAADSVGPAPFPDAFHQAMEEEAWTVPSRTVVAVVEVNAMTLAHLDEAARKQPARFPVGSILAKPGVYRLPLLLFARGRLEIERGDLSAALDTAGVLKKMGTDLSTVIPDGDQPRQPLLGVLAEGKASDLLARLAVHPALDGATAGRALALAEGPWRTETYLAEGLLPAEDWFDRMCAWSLGPEAEAWAEGRSASGIDEMWDRIVRERAPGRAVRLPGVGELRAMRAVAAEVREAARRRDLALLAPGGLLDASFGRWKGEDLGLNELGCAGPEWVRGAFRWEANVAVARTALAVRSFQIRTGRAPDSLEELVPGTVRAVPLDPFDGKPLTYDIGPGDGWCVRSRVWQVDGEPIEVRFRPAGK